MDQKRENGTFRALYLLAILFVVDGHDPLPDLFDLGGLMAYYSFHMMLFAFGSGYFFRLHGGAGRDLAHRARRLLVPLYAYNLLYGLLGAALRRFAGFRFGAPISAYTLLLAPLVDGEHFSWNLGAWYIFPLFLTQVFYAGLSRVLRRGRFPLCLALGVAAFSLHARLGLPLFLFRPLALLPAYAAGAAYRAHWEARDTLPDLPFFAGLIALRGALLLLFGRLSYLLSSGTFVDCGAIGVYASAATGIALWLRVARRIAPAVEQSRLALAVSRRTLPILMHHYVGFAALNFLFLMAHLLGLAPDFHVGALRASVAFVYAPGEKAAFALLYLLFGVGVSLLLALLTERLLALLRRGLHIRA